MDDQGKKTHGDNSDDPNYRISSAAGSLLRRIRDEAEQEEASEETPSEVFDPQGRYTPNVPLSASELKLIQELQSRQPDPIARVDERKLLGNTAPPEPLQQTTGSMSAFPDLPPELRPQRADGTGALTMRDIQEMERKGTMPLLNKIAARQAQVAISHLQEKMEEVATEFSDGQINHAQFLAVYTRYAEQRAMIERMRNTDPRSTAWMESLIQHGETAVLRKQHQAVAVGCLIVDNMQAKIIRTFGKFDLEGDFLSPILSNLTRALLDSTGLQERATQIDGGRWLSIAPGQFATTIVIFSMEPAAAQRTAVGDLHRDFERANFRVLSNGQAQPSRLVYPHRLLFEDE
jgi:hypothetical protein